MPQLNYFKPIEELSEDFKELTIGRQNIELTTLLERYIINSREDFKLIGKNTSLTENMYRVYSHLKDIQLKQIQKLVGN